MKIDFKELEKQILDWGDSVPVEKVFLILGFSRKDNFVRLLKSPKYEFGVYYNWEDKINTISLRLFFNLAESRLNWNDDWENLFTKVWTNLFESKMLKFTKASHKSDYRFDDYSGKIKGKFYTYSIDTRNIADDNNMCPYELYKHCAEKYVRRGDNLKGRINYDSTIPYISFNSTQHTKRYRAIIYIEQVLEQIPMNKLQKRKMQIYAEVLKQMLMLQFECDVKREETEKRRKERLDQALFGGVVSDEDLSQLKKLYRGAAMLCHPDVTESDGTMFMKLNEAYNAKNLNKVKSIFSRLQSA